MEIGKLYLIKEDVSVYSETDRAIIRIYCTLNENNIVLCLKQLGHDYGYNFLYLFKNKTIFFGYTPLKKIIMDLFLEELK